MMSTKKHTICLWYTHDAKAARFYARTFPESAVGAVLRAPSDFPDSKAGDVLTVEFTVCGAPCFGLNGGEVAKLAFEAMMTAKAQIHTTRQT